MFEIGNSLREARLRQQIDLAEAEQGTKIRSKYLRALEDERFELLPAETYVKGFLRSYAEYLGLDGQLYVDEFNSRYVVGEEEAPVRPRANASARQAQRRVESRALAGALAGIAAAVALVIIAWKWGESEPQRIRIATQPRAAAPAATTAASPAARPREVWVSLELAAARGSSWLVVRRGGTNGRLLFEGTLETGQQKRFAGKTLWANVGAPRNLTARLNDKPTRVPGGNAPIVVRVDRRGIKLWPA